MACTPGAVLTLPLTETSPGVYETWWSVPADLAAGVYNLVGCLTIGGAPKAVTPPAVLLVLGPLPPPPTAPALGAAAPPPAPGAAPPSPPAPGAPPPPPPAPPPTEAPPTITQVQLVPQAPAYPAAPGGDSTLPQAPTWASTPTRAVPAGELWVTPDDFLVLGVRNSLANVALTLSVRMWGADGQFTGGSVTVTPPSDRSLNYYTMPLAYGYICEVAVVASTGTPQRGRTLAQVLLARGPKTAFTTYAILCQDYITSFTKVGWPPGQIIPGTSRPGYTNFVQFATGAQTIPTGARWILQWVQGGIITSGAAKNRWARLTYTPPQTNATDFEVMSTSGVPANTTADQYFVLGLGSGQSDASAGLPTLRIATPLPPVEGIAGGNWQAAWYNQDAGNDSPQFWYMFYEEVLEIG